MKKKLVILLLVLLLAGGGVYAWRALSDGEGETLSLSGNVDIRSVGLSFRVGGRLQSLKVDEGDAVKAGDEVGSLDSEPYDLALRQAEAEVETCRRAITQAEGSARALGATYDLYRAGYRQEEIDQARATLESQRAILDNAQKEYARQKSLLERNAVSRQAFDEAEKTLRSQTALVAADEAKLAELEAGYRKEEIAQAQAQHEAALTAVEEARAKLAAAEVARDQAELNLRDTKLVAPSDGIIMTRTLEPGSMVTSGATVLTLSLRHPVWVRAYVDEVNLDRIHIGQKVAVTTDGGGRYEGTVGYVSPQSEFTPKTVETSDIRTTLVYRLRIIVEGEGASRLNQGAPVRVEVPLENSEGE